MNQESKLEQESYNEILFFKPMLQPLNFVPFLLTIWSSIRVYILPGLSLLLPLLSLIAPYLILRFLFRIPMNLSNYMNILQAMLSGNFHQVVNPEVAKPQALSPINFLKQFGVVLVTFIQGIIQPYWTFKHLHSIDTIVCDHGKLVMRFQELYESLHLLLSKRGFTFFKSPLPKMETDRDATARIILESNYFKLALKYVGGLEVIMCLANQKRSILSNGSDPKHPFFGSSIHLIFRSRLLRERQFQRNLIPNATLYLQDPIKEVNRLYCAHFRSAHYWRIRMAVRWVNLLQHHFVIFMYA